MRTHTHTPRAVSITRPSLSERGRCWSESSLRIYVKYNQKRRTRLFRVRVPRPSFLHPIATTPTTRAAAPRLPTVPPPASSTSPFGGDGSATTPVRSSTHGARGGQSGGGSSTHVPSSLPSLELANVFRGVIGRAVSGHSPPTQRVSPASPAPSPPHQWHSWPRAWPHSRRRNNYDGPTGLRPPGEPIVV